MTVAVDNPTRVVQEFAGHTFERQRGAQHRVPAVLLQSSGGDLSGTAIGHARSDWRPDRYARVLCSRLLDLSYLCAGTHN